MKAKGAKNASSPGSHVDVCPLVAEPPFCSPWRRAVPAVVQARIGTWITELHTRADVKLASVVEWVSPDPRTRVHAVLVAFVIGSDHREVVVFNAAERITRAELSRTLEDLTAEGAQPALRRAWLRAAGVSTHAFGAAPGGETS
jgi:hypothetical protein